MRRTGLLNGTNAPCVLACSFCRAHADVRWGQAKRLLRKTREIDLSGGTCSDQPASALATAPVDWHYQSDLRRAGARGQRRTFFRRAALQSDWSIVVNATGCRTR